MVSQILNYSLNKFCVYLISFAKRLVILEFLNNEDVKELYVYSKSPIHLVASNVCSLENSNEKGIFFLKIANAGKLTIENISN